MSRDVPRIKYENHEATTTLYDDNCSTHVYREFGKVVGMAKHVEDGHFRFYKKDSRKNKWKCTKLTFKDSWYSDFDHWFLRTCTNKFVTCEEPKIPHSKKDIVYVYDECYERECLYFRGGVHVDMNEYDISFDSSNPLKFSVVTRNRKHISYDGCYPVFPDDPVLEQADRFYFKIQNSEFDYDEVRELFRKFIQDPYYGKEAKKLLNAKGVNVSGLV